MRVDADHQGTPEREWLRSGVLDEVPAWSPPPARRVLLVAPHPDDEVLGAPGVALAAAARGAEVVLLAVTDGDGSHPRSPTVDRPTLAAVRRRESVEGLRRLGLEAPTTRLGIGDGHVGDAVDDVAEAIAARTGPGDIVLAPWAHDGHRDHDACGRAARAASAAVGATLVEYLVWAWHWATPDGGIPLQRAARLDIGRRGAAAKRWATSAHRSQVRPLSDAEGDEAVLPPGVLRRSWRPYEVVLR